MVTQPKIIEAKSGNVTVPKAKKNPKEVYKIEGRVTTSRAQAKVVRPVSAKTLLDFIYHSSLLVLLDFILQIDFRSKKKIGPHQLQIPILSAFVTPEVKEHLFSSYSLSISLSNQKIYWIDLLRS